MKIQRQQHQGTRQKLYRQIITILLAMQIFLFSIQAKNRIEKGDSAIEVIIWLINQCFLVMQSAKNLENNEKKEDK